MAEIAIIVGGALVLLGLIGFVVLRLTEGQDSEYEPMGSHFDYRPYKERHPEKPTPVNRCRTNGGRNWTP